MYIEIITFICIFSFLADKCRNRWHCLRDKFRRLHRDATIWALERGVDISQINMNSKYYDLLSFLAEFMQPHK